MQQLTIAYIGISVLTILLIVLGARSHRLYSKIKILASMMGCCLELDHSWVGWVVQPVDFYERILPANHYDGIKYLVSLSVPWRKKPFLLHISNEMYKTLKGNIIK